MRFPTRAQLLRFREVWSRVYDSLFCGAVGSTCYATLQAGVLRFCSTDKGHSNATWHIRSLIETGFNCKLWRWRYIRNGSIFTKRSVASDFREKNVTMTTDNTVLFRILCKRLRFHPYRLQLLQALKLMDKMLRRNFYTISVQTVIENDDEFIRSMVFCDEAIFHPSGKVNKHNLRIWGSENPRTYVELDYKLDVCRVTLNIFKCIGPVSTQHRHEFGRAAIGSKIRFRKRAIVVGGIIVLTTCYLFLVG
ncbi:hypothetical protein ANN_24184 [Periplaneta americana]|uniref:Uncharacterized protein n=1 Tax=Periplaneta americana TaxID=6978 RepID=A0ABQ8S2D7_PERAM|nr:hypothetical protein ANN_24184 [Periplaneta americana]